MKINYLILYQKVLIHLGEPIKFSPTPIYFLKGKTTKSNLEYKFEKSA